MRTGHPVRITTAAARFLLATILVALPVLTLIRTAEPVLAGPPCYDTSCNYYDPQIDFNGVCAGSNAVTIDWVTSNTYAYEDDLRWANFCGANWGKSWNIACDSYGNCISAYVFQSYKNGTTLTLNNWYDDHVAHQAHWSLMLSGASSVDRTCLYENRSVCTPWH